MSMSKNDLRNYEYRRCRFCHQHGSPNNVNDDEDQNLFKPCECLTLLNGLPNLAHGHCLRKFMIENECIDCEQCRCQFIGIKYRYDRKTFLEWLWSSQSARNSLLSCFSLICSSQVCLYSLYQTLFTDEFDDFMEDIFEFSLDFWPINQCKETISTDLNILMLIQLKLILPVISLIGTMKQPFIIWNEFIEYRKNHFNIYFD